MAYGDTSVVVASGARTTTGNSGTLTLLEKGEALNLLVNVSAASGTTPTMDLKVQWSHDGGTTFADPDAADGFVQVTAAKVTVKQFAIRGPVYRIVWTIGGTTPSFTFSVSGHVTH